MQGGAGEQGALFPARLEAVIFFEPREPEGFSAVDFIPHNLQIHMTGVDADLMQALRDRLGTQQGEARARKILHQGEPGPRLFAIVPVHAHGVRLDRVRREFGVHFKFPLQQLPAHEGEVMDPDFSRAG